jgi:hypothetical protein
VNRRLKAVTIRPCHSGSGVIGYANKPGKAETLPEVQAAAVTTDLAENTAAMRADSGM